MAQVYVWEEASGGQQALRGPFLEVPQSALDMVEAEEALILQESELSALELALVQEDGSGFLERDTSDYGEVLELGDRAGIARPEGLNEDEVEEFVEEEEETWNAYYEQVRGAFPHLMCFALGEKLEG